MALKEKKSPSKNRLISPLILLVPSSVDPVLISRGANLWRPAASQKCPIHYVKTALMDRGKGYNFITQAHNEGNGNNKTDLQIGNRFKDNFLLITQLAGSTSKEVFKFRALNSERVERLENAGRPETGKE